MNIRDLLKKIEKRAREKYARVGIGARFQTKEQFLTIYRSAQQAVNRKLARVTIFGETGRMRGDFTSNIRLHQTRSPEESLLEELKNGNLDAVVRGSAEAHLFIKEVKDTFNIKILYRIALLETASRSPFFLAPVGIDEGDTFREKMDFISYATELHRIFNIKPRIAILAGGRQEDRGRSPRVNTSLEMGARLFKAAKERWPDIDIHNYGILIEDALKEKATFILAPNGISGNLIFRTLTFLGAGRAIGAPYMNLHHPIVDTSRVMNDYTDAIAFAGALLKNT